MQKTTNMFLNYAAIAGAILGFVCILCSVFTISTLKMESRIYATIINFILWTVKFIVCSTILYYSMRLIAKKMPACTRSTTFLFGFCASVFSAILISLYSYADAQYFRPEVFQQSFSTIINSYMGKFDSNSVSALAKVREYFPIINLFSNFIYCSIFGIIISGIFSYYIPNKKNNLSDEQ